MDLAVLEGADHIIRECSFAGSTLSAGFSLYGRPDEERVLIQCLLEDGQFHVLLDLKRAEQHVGLALERLSPQTEYLRSELQQQLEHLRVLFEKVEREEHLRRDRDALLSSAMVNT
jgi:hypothetical protein